MKTTFANKLIVCTMGQGLGAGVVERLALELGIEAANVSSGRGRGAGSLGSIGAWDEVDTLAVVVPAERADEVFSFIFHAADLARPRGGIMFQHSLGEATPCSLPAVDDGEA